MSENNPEKLKKEIMEKQKISESQFRAKFTETLKAISKVTDIYVNGKNGNVQPIRDK